VYEITTQGKLELDRRISTLTQKKARMEILLQEYLRTGEPK
jgi:hypothetical protein